VAAALTVGLTFIDTNVLLYAQDRQDDRRRGIAQDLLNGLWATASGALSTQVLQEFYDVGTRKLKLQPVLARRVVASYAAWPVVETTPQLIVSASLLHERHGFAFWDAMVVEAALLSGATTLLSEDMQHERRIAGMTISNPFG
jgi:predicted nucleic acid-binding protein